MKLKRYDIGTKRSAIGCLCEFEEKEFDLGNYVKYEDIRWHDAEKEKPDHIYDILLKLKCKETESECYAIGFYDGCKFYIYNEDCFSIMKTIAWMEIPE